MMPGKTQTFANSEEINSSESLSSSSMTSSMSSTGVGGNEAVTLPQSSSASSSASSSLSCANSSSSNVTTSHQYNHVSGTRAKIVPYNNGSRRSAFSPYRPSTMLTNLQRGNVQHQQPSNPVLRTWHELAAQGELLEVHLNDSAAKSGIDELDSKGYTPLLWAAYYGQLATVKLLLQHGANPALRGLNGETALLFAAANGQVHVVKELLQRYSHLVDVNETDHDGNTALMYAAAHNHALVVHELLKHNADMSARNLYNDTAYAIAERKKSKQAQTVLEKHLLTKLVEAYSGKGSSAERTILLSGTINNPSKRDPIK